ncbi:hypothetical protein [Senegalia massiliensis]|uniref:hypothetical protein n=1 Tax=Senegalia massiliensis TaxID=1720316 RepID=UPI0010309C99|nr:hypothetical protein [Senegalia massiliensis]
MKAKVIKRFIDKETKKTNEIDEEITVNKERFKEINSHSLGPFLEEIKESKEETQKEKESTKK